MNHHSKPKAELIKELLELQAENSALKTSRDSEDIENMQNKKQQQDREERFRALYKNMNEGLALHEILFNDQGVQEDYVIIEANPVFEKQPGISKNDVLGKTSKEAFGVTEPPNLDIYFKPIILTDLIMLVNRHFN
jgi:PAS domain-containing protein